MKEALKLALEALELAHPRFGIATEKHKQAITSIKAALAQPTNHSEQHLDMVKAQPAQQDWKKLSPEEPPLVKWAKEQPEQQEPVATFWQHGETGRTRITMPGDITDCDARWFKAADLYTSPPQRTEERNFCSRCGKRTADLTVIHTCTPPQENT